ncbi:MAG: hypothetical protein ACR2PH_01435 [Desulfobulbia bacterium]
MKAKKQEKKVAVTFLLSPGDHKRLSAIAEKTGVSMAAMIRIWIRREA